MALVRLANLNDYESVDVLGRTMFKITWCPTLCPGSPTEDPREGLELFNEWQCAVAAGLDNLPGPAEKLAVIVHWCLTTGSPDRVNLAKELVKANRNKDYEVRLEFNNNDYAEPGLGYRYELAFLKTQIRLLAAAQVMQLQNLIQVVEYD